MQHCPNCGERLSPAARFCPGCGAAADAEMTRVAAEETRVRSTPPRPVVPVPRAPDLPVREPARAPAVQPDEERVVFTVRPTLLFVKIGYALAALVGLVLVGLSAYFFGGYPFYLSLAVALALLLVPAYHHLRRQMLRYTLTDSKIEINEGLLSQTTRNIPLRNIQDVTVKMSLFQRLLGFGDVVIDNAGGEGSTTVLDNIPEPRRHMDMILRELRRWR
jgi:membrane protein YdbS with pleckstrin-like domain